MTQYVKVTNGKVVKYPVTQSEIVHENPETSFPVYPLSDELMLSHDCHPVVPVIPPTVGFGEQFLELLPQLIDDVWTQAWEVIPMTTEQLAALHESVKSNITAQTQQRLDAFAQTRGYDGILSAASYAASSNPTRRVEGQYAVDCRDATWDKLYEILAAVVAQTRPIPQSFAEIESELPALAWPV